MIRGSETLGMGPEGGVAEEAEAPEPGLVARVRAGEASAFDELARLHLGRVFAIVYRVLGQREDAEDVTQEVFLAVLEKIDTYDPRRPFAPWIHRIAMNRAINARKARGLRRTDEIPESAAAPGDEPDVAAAKAEERERLARAMLELPERQRLIVRLFDLEGFSSVEIGSMLGMADGTVRWHLHQARERLRRVLAPTEEWHP